MPTDVPKIKSTEKELPGVKLPEAGESSNKASLGPGESAESKNRGGMVKLSVIKAKNKTMSMAQKKTRKYLKEFEN